MQVALEGMGSKRRQQHRQRHIARLVDAALNKRNIPIAPEAKPETKRKEPSKAWKFAKSTIKILGIGGLLSLLGSYQLLRPKLALEPDAPLDPKWSLSVPFALKNGSFFAIKEVRVVWKLGPIAFRDIEIKDNIANLITDNFPVIEPDGVTTLNSISRIVKMEQAQIPWIEAEVRFKYPVIGRRKARFRFTAVQQVDGAYRWQKQLANPEEFPPSPGEVN